MSLQNRKNKILPMVLVDLANSNPKQPFDRLALFAEDGTPIVPGSLGGGGGTGPAGKSAYQVWLDAGNTGTVNAYLASLKGAKGDAGTNGTNGANGVDGDSAYDIWLANGNSGDVNAYLASLKGAKGDKGDSGNTELAYNEKIDADYSTTSLGPVDIGTGTSITFTAGTRPVSVLFGAADMWHSVAGTLCLLLLVRQSDGVGVAALRGSHPTVNGRIALGTGRARLSGLTPGQQYTYKLQSQMGAAGTMKIASNANMPLWIQAVEV